MEGQGKNQSPKKQFGNGHGGRPQRSGRRGSQKDRPEAKEFEQKILDLSRVTRVTAGGKRMSFRCALVIGDRKGRVGFGIAKGGDVQVAIEKAFRQAKKCILQVPIVNETLPHMIRMKYGSACILLKPAPRGTGLKAGGAVRVLLELGGVANAVSKITNSKNKVNIAKATINALRSLQGKERKRPVDQKGAEQDASKTN
ncbi:TPA: 30S ribosomal protein S5 [Candidatus Uhrbacteria bacterium]|uniref:Small ribosomal subunit protein uS5 n=2 Tax=Candidatus Uhriibacteriota TaxID=1752732 RepID=A0A0G1Q887_9BACT|nr:MAG: ribosomal protein S5, nonfunctional [Candidatus Uhrbacteria bacterium GW2011_GWF2_46_218]KKU41199.1 MAG: ribosomal protein S5, nonfunctional [Candidatus Uhrbacteria bacterium GW2011_GWE2_46_68]HBK34047.1 30S ribosomal protein S5 [Candidatus Uhrbacteria bacterium]HCB18875.1 30S ribosomal protein S5 [Candidatus Uhrbacteria bacterium]